MVRLNSSGGTEMEKSPIVDRCFAERFMRAVDRPMEYGVYFLFHDWWAQAPQRAIDAYQAELNAIPEARAFIDRQFIAEPIALERLQDCAPGTLGAGYYRFVIDNKLEKNLATNYRTFNEELHQSGKLDRLPEAGDFWIDREVGRAYLRVDIDPVRYGCPVRSVANHDQGEALSPCLHRPTASQPRVRGSAEGQLALLLVSAKPTVAIVGLHFVATNFVEITLERDLAADRFVAVEPIVDADHLE